MARTRAADYDLKQNSILCEAARLFARDGYDRTSMASLAEACGTSKALLYHYYKNKDALLFDVLSDHLHELIDTVELADDPAADPDSRLNYLVSALLDAYRDADDCHKMQISELSKLPRPMQNKLKALERRLVDKFTDALLGINPGLDDGRGMIKPATMSLFGMLNWHYMWFRPNGPMSREDYAQFVSTIIADGVRGLTQKRR